MATNKKKHKICTPDIGEMFSTLSRFLLALRFLLSSVLLDSVHSGKQINTLEIISSQDSMETIITHRKWTWIGHTMRKAGSSIMKKLWDEPLKVGKTEEDQRTHGRGQLRRSWEAWNWAGAKRRARHKIGRSGGVSSTACAPAGVERQRRSSSKKLEMLWLILTIKTEKVTGMQRSYIYNDTPIP